MKYNQIKIENLASLKTDVEEQHQHKNEQLKNQYNYTFNNDLFNKF